MEPLIAAVKLDLALRELSICRDNYGVYICASGRSKLRYAHDNLLEVAQTYPDLFNPSLFVHDGVLLIRPRGTAAEMGVWE